MIFLYRVFNVKEFYKAERNSRWGGSFNAGPRRLPAATVVCLCPTSRYKLGRYSWFMNVSSLESEVIRLSLVVDVPFPCFLNDIHPTGQAIPIPILHWCHRLRRGRIIRRERIRLGCPCPICPEIMRDRVRRLVTTQSGCSCTSFLSRSCRRGTMFLCPTRTLVHRCQTEMAGLKHA